MDTTNSEKQDLDGGAEHVVQADGCIVGPGFVDPHCHGDGTTCFFENPGRVVRNLLMGGTTTSLATLGYPDMQPGQVERQLDDFWRALGPQAAMVVAGIHLEGPYVNRKYGAQTFRGVIKDFDSGEYAKLLGNNDTLRIRWWTCAPELDGAGAFIAAASQRGVVVAAGHSEATPDQLFAAAGAGLRAVTHWSNATGNPRPPVYAGTRSPGIDEASLVFDDLSAEIIPDRKGCHVHRLMAKLLYRAKTADRILIITDGGYRRHDDPPALDACADVSIDAAGQLAGSRLSMVAAARNFLAVTGCTLPELFRMAALNSARLLKLDQTIGSLEPGKRANIVMVDEAFDLRMTMLDGQISYQRDEAATSDRTARFLAPSPRA